MNHAARILLPVLVLLLVTAAAELLVRGGFVQEFILPPPTQVARTLVEDFAQMRDALLSTGMSAVKGLGLSVAVGLALGIALSSNRWVRAAFLPYAIFFQTVPVIAIAPMLVVWLDYGSATVTASAFIASVFPVIASTLAGLLSTDPALRDLFRLYNAGWWRTMLKLRLPAALPEIMTGLRVAAGLAVVGAVVGEFIGGGGLGAIVEVAKTQLRTDKVFAAVLLASLLGLALFTAVNLLSFFTLRRWHASQQNPT